MSNQMLEFRPAASPQTSIALAAAEDAVARLDERLATSPIAAAFMARTHLADAAAALFLEGELVPLEDLALHDAAADIHAPTHALIRAHAALRARRRVAAAAPGWAVGAEALSALRGQAPHKDASGTPPEKDSIAEEEDAFAAELAAMDALIARSRRVLDERPAMPAADSLPEPSPELPGQTRDRLADWRARVDDTKAETPVLAAAFAGAALDALAPLPNEAWLGRLVIADLLRARGKTRHHLLAINLGLKLVPREARRRSADRTALWIAAITTAAEEGRREHDRLLNACRGLERRLAGRRSTSKLPALIALVMRAPVVSSQTIAAELEVTPRAAQDLVAALGLRELTGRTRYRCWGIL